MVTSKGQVTIPKELRDRYDIQPGAEVDFVPVGDGIRLRKVVDRRKQARVLGCLKAELAGHTVTDLLNDLRGVAELPKNARKEKRK